MQKNLSKDKRISLIINRKNFEEIYFEGKQKSLLFSTTVKGKTITTIIVSVILILLIIFRNFLSDEKQGIIYFVSFLFLLCAVYLSLAVNKVSRWRKEVVNYLNKLEKFSTYEILFNNETFTVKMGKIEESSLWEDFTSAEIQDNYISIEGKYHYMFPRKSFQQNDFSQLKKAVENNILKIKNSA